MSEISFLFHLAWFVFASLPPLHLYFLLNQFLFIFFSSCLKITLSNSILWVNNLFWELVFHGCVLPNALPYRATSWLLFSCPVMSDSLWPHGLQDARPLCPSPSLKVCPKFASVMPFSHLILWHPLLLLPSIFPSIRDFSNKSAVHIRRPKHWSFSFSISPFNKYSGLISLKIDWFDLFAVQGTLGSLLQHHSSKTSILWHSAFFTVQLSQPYMTTEKTIVSTIRTFAGRVMCLLLNTLSRFVIAFLPRSNCLLISWLQSPSPVILEPKKRKIVTTSTFSLSICLEVMGPDAMIFIFLISFKLVLSLSSFTIIKRLSSSSSLSTIRVVSPAYLRL